MAKKLNRGLKALGKIVIPKWALDDELLLGVEDRIGGILFAYGATHEKMDELSRDEMWLDLKLSRRDNKDRMKELGGAPFGYRRFLVEMVISSTANAIDSVRAQIIRVTGVRIDFWKKSPRVPRLKLARKVLSLNNVIKHNRGVLRHGSSESADFLIDQCGLPDRADIYLIPFNLEFMLREIYGFLLNLCSFAMRRAPSPSERGGAILPKAAPRFCLGRNKACAVLLAWPKEPFSHDLGRWDLTCGLRQIVGPARKTRGPRLLSLHVMPMENF